ncbi:MAG: FapA family protein [Eubacteriales bacterium]|nr:FapA family protein [Eubacteriales bacterium]
MEDKQSIAETNCDKSEGSVLEIQLEEENTQCQLFSQDAKYKISFLEDGVYLNVTKEIGDGKPLEPDLVVYDINRRSIKGLDISNVLLRLKKHELNIKLADTQDEITVDLDVVVVTTKDEMSASMMLFPPSEGGNRKTADEIINKIKTDGGITFGLEPEDIRYAVENEQYYRNIEIARGRQPQKGKDGYAKILFNTEHDNTPMVNNDGSVDYKNLNLFENVIEGATIVTKIPPEEGVDGYSVKGNTLPAKKGLEAKLPKGINVKVSEDGESLIAAKSGRIDYVNGRVEISDVFKILGDVDISIGNVFFEGDVVVRGNVIDGLTIQSSGKIEVNGYVEGATLIAGNDIILKNGIQGRGKGKLIAGGNIVARFMERCTAEVRGDIFSDYIVHCSVVAGGSVIMKGKWGRIIGGAIRAGKEITANVIGSPTNDPTLIELGTSPQMRVRYNELETMREQVKAQLNKIDNIAKITPSHNDSPERKAMRQKLINTREQINEQYYEVQNELMALTEELSEQSDGRINVISCVYPNVKIIIDSCLLTTKSMFEYVTFRHKDGEIIFPSCEIRQ